MQQTISQAAQLYGKARSTIHRAIDAGRLSCSVRGDGVRVIQLAELIRLWGEPPNAPPQTQQNATPQTDDTQQVQQAMLDELRALRAEVAALRQEMRLLPAPRVDEVDAIDGPGSAQKRERAEPEPQADPNGLRALVDALRS